MSQPRSATRLQGALFFPSAGTTRSEAGQSGAWELRADGPRRARGLKRSRAAPVPCPGSWAAGLAPLPALPERTRMAPDRRL